MVDERQQRVHKGVDDKGEERQANVDEELVPSLGLVGFVQGGDDAEDELA